jgi:hypothetical protein
MFLVFTLYGPGVENLLNLSLDVELLKSRGLNIVHIVRRKLVATAIIS